MSPWFAFLHGNAAFLHGNAAYPWRNTVPILLLFYNNMSYPESLIAVTSNLDQSQFNQFICSPNSHVPSHPCRFCRQHNFSTHLFLLKRFDQNCMCQPIGTYASRSL